MTYDFILVRYGELALKGKNRKVFEQQLQQNIKEVTRDLNIKITRTFGRMYILLQDEAYEVVAERLKKVFGIKSFSPAIKVNLDVDEIREQALQLLRKQSPQPKTFKVNVRRSNKQFPYNSQEMNHKIGTHILVNTPEIKVDVHHPELEMVIEIREEAAYIMCERIEGAGGLPIGTSGKVMLLLSGGIDSPVAGYLCLKRGLRIEAVHFHSFPFTSEKAKQKVVDLAQKLTAYAGRIKLHVVPFTEIQTQIKQHIPEDYSITIMRRMMLRITEAIADNQKALGLATGDNLGQVASQTLQSMHTINEVTNMPIIRPLVTMDKLEIIDIAQEIDTFDISILPYEDCCTIFQPKNPKTRPTRKFSAKIERHLDLEALVADAVERTETLSLVYGRETPGHVSQVQESALDELF